MLLSGSSSVDSAVQFFTVLIIFILVLGITFFVTRWIAGFQKNQMSGGNVTVIETTKISPNQYIQIVKIGERYIAIATGKDNVTFLSNLDKDELDLDKQGLASADFSTVLKKFGTGFSKKEELESDDSSKDEE